MTPNNFDDIIPPEKQPENSPASRRSIRDIPLREHKPNKIDELLEETSEMRSENNIHKPIYNPPMPKMNKRKEGHKTLLIVLSSIVVIIILGIVALYVFGNAVINVSIKSDNFPVTFSAVGVSNSSENVASSTFATGTLMYKPVSIVKEDTREVTPTGQSSSVNDKASGTITIYNSYSSASQQLVATTRFQTTDGLVYRINKPVTVPGTSEVGGKTVPGSVNAVVYADQAGDKYNIATSSTFTIPGFSGGPKFNGFSAKSVSPITGGFVGSVPSVSDSDLQSANTDLQKSLTSETISDVNTQDGNTNTFFKNGLRSTYTYTITSGTDGKAVIDGKLTSVALTFDTNAVEGIISNIENDQHYKFENLGDLDLTIANDKTVDSYLNNPLLSLSFSGTLTTGQSFDINDLKNTLAGKARIQLSQILKMYPEVTGATSKIRPFWASSFPSNPNKIDIIVTKQ